MMGSGTELWLMRMCLGPWAPLEGPLGMEWVAGEVAKLDASLGAQKS